MTVTNHKTTVAQETMTPVSCASPTRTPRQAAQGHPDQARPSRLPAPAPRPTRPHLLPVAVVVVVVAGMVLPVSGGIMDSVPTFIQFGTCAQPQDNGTLDFEQFSGLWHQVESVPNSFMQVKECITLDFNWNGEQFHVITEGVDEYGDQAVQEATISQVLPDDPATSKPYLQIYSPGVPSVPYHVLDTDYHSYACVYSCFEVFSMMMEVFSVLSRTPAASDASLASCYRSFKTLHVDVGKLEKMVQEGDCQAAPATGSEAAAEREEGEATMRSEEARQSGGDRPAAGGEVMETQGEGVLEEVEDVLRLMVEEIEGGDREGGAEVPSSSFSFSSSNSETGSSEEGGGASDQRVSLFHESQTNHETEERTADVTMEANSPKFQNYRKKPKSQRRRKHPGGKRRSKCGSKKLVGGTWRCEKQTHPVSHPRPEPRTKPPPHFNNKSTTRNRKPQPTVALVTAEPATRLPQSPGTAPVITLSLPLFISLSVCVLTI